jgi:hypothetical protein
VSSGSRPSSSERIVRTAADRLLFEMKVVDTSRRRMLMAGHIPMGWSEGEVVYNDHDATYEQALEGHAYAVEVMRVDRLLR